MTNATARPMLASLISLALVASCAKAEPLRDWMTDRTGQADMPIFELTLPDATRSYRLFHPDGFKGPLPTIIMLHGGGGNAQSAANVTGFNDLAERKGFAVVYPNGSGSGRFLTWNAGHCCQFAMEQDIDDIALLAALIDDLVARGEADPTRIYVTGMSNGAMMAHRAGRELSRKIAGIAPVVGAIFGDEAPAAGPVPILFITGALDENVPAAGGNGVHPRRDNPNDLPYAPAEAALDYWTQNNGCAGQVRSVTTNVFTLRLGQDCRAGVQWYHLAQGTHSWPGGKKGGRNGDEPVSNFDASTFIWRFFRQHRLD